MGSIISRLKHFKARVIAAFASLILMNLYFIRLQQFCIPVFNCHSCPAAVFACPLGTLVNFSILKLFPFMVLGVLGIVSIFGGRIVCGWLCPFGMLQDGLYRIPVKKIRIPFSLRWTKYIVLILFVFLIPFLFPNTRFTFCHLCPVGTLESTIPWKIMGVSSGNPFGYWMRMGIMAGVLILAIFSSRAFCRMFCPLGAIFSIFNKFSLFRYRLEKCTSCGLCRKKCPVEIDPVKQMNSPECVRCADCTTCGQIRTGIR